MRAIRKELPALLTTLQQLYETTGDAEAFGLSTLLACFTGVASVFFLSEVLDILAKMNATMQRKAANFSKLQICCNSGGGGLGKEGERECESESKRESERERKREGGREILQVYIQYIIHRFATVALQVNCGYARTARE